MERGIPKRGSPEKRPLGIPTQQERARQTLVRQALEPEWEAKLSPHTYGFRPGRSCWDAIEAIFNSIRFRPQYALKVDIAKCFDRIDHAGLLAKTRVSPCIRRQLKAWLQAGILEDGHLAPTTAGDPARRYNFPIASADRSAWYGRGHHPRLPTRLGHRLCR